MRARFSGARGDPDAMAPQLTVDAVRSQVTHALAHGQLVLQRLDGEIGQASALGWLNLVSARTRVPRVYVFLALVAVSFAFLFIGVGAPFFSYIVGFTYPAYASLKAIEAPHATPAAVKHDATQWLTYWIIFSASSLADPLLDWVPFYFAIKVAFLLWAQMPMFRGAEALYGALLRPAFLRNQPVIDAQFERLQGAGTAFRNVIGFDPLARLAADGGAGAGGGNGASAPVEPGREGDAAQPDLSQIFGSGQPPSSAGGAGAAGGAASGGAEESGAGGKRRD